MAFAYALQLAAHHIINQAKGLLSLVNDSEFSLAPSRNLISEKKISVPQVLRSHWEDMALLDERFQVMTGLLVRQIEQVNRRLDDWIDYKELSKSMSQEEMKETHPEVEKHLEDIETAADHLFGELEEWMQKTTTIDQSNRSKAVK
jgi:hypothetical protein